MEPSPKAGTAHDDAPSTGFLPITLALGLFVTGLFALGILPGFSCDGTEASQR
jgi:hypothetical protein